MTAKFIVNEDHASGDFVFDAYGETIEELFTACARACFFAMTDVDSIEPLLPHEFEVTGDSIDDLLYNFVSELIYLKDARKMLFSEFKITFAPDEKSLKAVASGEQIDHDRHILKTDVKAVTYHGLEVKKTGRGYMTRMILDL